MTEHARLTREAPTAGDLLRMVNDDAVLARPNQNFVIYTLRIAKCK